MAYNASNGAVGSGIGENLGGILGDFLGQGDRDSAARRYQDALNQLMGTNIEAGPSAYDQVSDDPRLKVAQLSALDKLQQEGAAGGMNTEDRVAYNQAANATAQRERGSREAIMQSMAMRGQGGSGAELAANLANQQGAAQSNAAAGAQAAAQARQRALSSIAQSGQLAGQVRGQDFGEAAQKADAQNAINRFNASQRLTRAGMATNIYGAQANQDNANADHWQQRGSGIGSSLGSLAGAF